MARKHILWVLMVFFSGAVPGPGRTEDEGAGDLVAIMPIGQGRVFDSRFYGGPNETGFALSPDGKYAVGSINGNQLMIFEFGKARMGRQGRSLQGDNQGFYGRHVLAFTPDAKTLIGMSNNFPDQNLYFWDLASGKEIRQIDNDQQFYCLAVSPDGKLLALGTNQRVEVWDLASLDDVHMFQSPTALYQAVAFSGDGRMLAAATRDAIQVWELATGKERLVIRLEAVPQNPNNIFRDGPMMNLSVSAIGFSADGNILAVGTRDKSIRLWNLRTGQELPPLVGHQSPVSALVFTADGKRLMSMDGQGLKLEWAVRRLGKPGPAKLRPPTDGELADLWESLADADAFQIYRTARFFGADPARGLAFLQKRLAPVPAGNIDQIKQLVTAMQNGRGADRRKAMAALRKHGEAAIGALQEAVLNNVGVNQNVVMMLNKLEPLYNTPERQRTVKAVQILEHIANPEAVKVLEKLAKGAPGTRLTMAAKGALDRLQKRPSPGQVRVSDPKTLWDDLAADDAPRAFQAIGQLAAQPDKALPWLREHLKPVALPSSSHLDELVAGLDASDFATRQKAMAELNKLGETAVPAMKKALKGKISLEAQKRMEQLLGRIERQNLSSYQLQQIRALEAVEQIASVQAREFLHELARGAPGARITREASAALARLERRSGK